MAGSLGLEAQFLQAANAPFKNVKLYRAMLERLEWVDMQVRDVHGTWWEAVDTCPECHALKTNGHYADCELGNLLKGV